MQEIMCISQCTRRFVRICRVSGQFSRLLHLPCGHSALYLLLVRARQGVPPPAPGLPGASPPLDAAVVRDVRLMERPPLQRHPVETPSGYVDCNDFGGKSGTNIRFADGAVHKRFVIKLDNCLV